MARVRAYAVPIGTAVVIAASLAVGYRLGTAHGDGAAVAPRPGTEARPANRRVRLAGALREHAGLRTEPVVRRTLAPVLALAGTVQFDADRVADVGSRISGRVARIFVRPGDEVLQHAPLAQVESAVLGDAVAVYLGARAHAIAARSEAVREQGLSRQGLTTAREREQAVAQTVENDAALRGAEQRLLAMGMEPGELATLSTATRARHVTLRAPLAGRVVTREAVLGQTVEPTATVLRVADLHVMWVQLDVFEKDLARVHTGAAVEIRSESWPDAVFRGVVNDIGAVLDPGTRTASVRIEVDNAQQLLRPGQFVTARLHASAAGDASAQSRESVVVPRRAVIQLDGRPAVFVQTAPDEYEPRVVEPGSVEGDAVEIVRGVGADELVVVDGVFALKSELLR